MLLQKLRLICTCVCVCVFVFRLAQLIGYKSHFIENVCDQASPTPNLDYNQLYMCIYNLWEIGLHKFLLLANGILIYKCFSNRKVDLKILWLNPILPLILTWTCINQEFHNFNPMELSIDIVFFILCILKIYQTRNILTCKS